MPVALTISGLNTPTRLGLSLSWQPVAFADSVVCPRAQFALQSEGALPSGPHTAQVQLHPSGTSSEH
jgi:hypothetical protein